MENFIINAMEGSGVDVDDITGAFLQTDMVHGNRIARVRLCGVLSDLLVKIDPLKVSEKVDLGGK